MLIDLGADAVSGHSLAVSSVRLLTAWTVGAAVLAALPWRRLGGSRRGFPHTAAQPPHGCCTCGAKRPASCRGVGLRRRLPDPAMFMGSTQMGSTHNDDVISETPITRPELVSGLSALGLSPGGADTIMLHTRMSAIGHVVGGAQTVVDALLEATGGGTVLALTGWEDRPPYDQEGWDEALRAAYRAHCPSFDPTVAMAEREFGRVPEAVRTRPGAHHSQHPVCAFAAVGQLARWLVADQDLDQGYGEKSPLRRLVDAGGHVLLLGAPLETVTLLHLAEYRAHVPGKRWATYEMPVAVDGTRTWRTTRELHSDEALPYGSLGLQWDAFRAIVADGLEAGIGRSGGVGAARSHLLPAGELLDHAVGWLERRFGA